MNSASSLPPGVTPEMVREELHRILDSPPFRGSKRSQNFLRHVVEQVLEGRLDELKERSIGIAVFERAPSYVTSEDATVRVTANEVRKRLAQHYLETEAGPVRLDLPSGTYIPSFQVPAAGRKPRRRSWLVRASIAAGLLALAAAGALLLPARSTPFDEFWTPVVKRPRPVLVCLTHPVVYLLADDFLQSYAARNRLDPLAGPRPIPVEPRDLKPGQIVPTTDQYVGSGDAYASSMLMALFTRMGKSCELRIGNDISFSDLRDTPAVLIGAYSNRWTMQANSDYRFAFDHFAVVDRRDPSRAWRLRNVSPDFKSNEDYAIVSRVFRSYTGELAVTAAGITNLGTRAAAEFLTNTAQFNRLMAGAPPDWARRNFQLVLHCKGIGNTPGPPEIVASHFWP